MLTSRALGIAFLAPALILIILFFFGPVLATSAFSLTNMSTATGIGGNGAYQIDPQTLQRLSDAYNAPALARQLEKQIYVVNQDTLEKMTAAGIDKQVVSELSADHLGERFGSRRDAESMIKELENRPSSIRMIKLVSEQMNLSLEGSRFATKADLLAAIVDLGLKLDAAQAKAVAQASYTGWVWTTGNFSRMATSPDARQNLLNTLIYVFFTLTLFNTGFGLVLAIATFYMPERTAGFFRSLWLLPRVSPPVIYVLLWKWLAWDTGSLSRFLGLFGVPPRNWMLDTPINAWVFVILINGFVGASMGMIIFSSAIRAIPRPLLYASEVDGASRWQQIRHIILPQLKWPILFITTYQTLSLLTSFDLILLSTDGGPGSSTEVWSLAVYHAALKAYSGNLQYGYGSAMALVLVVLGIVLSLGYLRLFDFGALVSRPLIEN